MDFFFQQEEEMQFEMIWPDIPEIIYTPADDSPAPIPTTSAFSLYTRRPGNSGLIIQMEENSSNSPTSRGGNMNRRMIDILQAVRAAGVFNREPLSGYRHMIKERQRRNKMRLNYEDLHSLLPSSTRADKNSIVKTAASHVLELQCLKRKLQCRNDELEAKLAKKDEEAEVAKINLKVMFPSSAMDSMVEVLKCLRDMKVKARAIKSVLSAEEFSATLDIDSKKNKTEEVEMAVKRSLIEVEERKVPFHFEETSRDEAVETWDLWEGQVA